MLLDVQGAMLALVARRYNNNQKAMQEQSLWVPGRGGTGRSNKSATRPVSESLWGYNPVCKVSPVILHGVESPCNPVSLSLMLTRADQCGVSIGLQGSALVGLVSAGTRPVSETYRCDIEVSTTHHVCACVGVYVVNRCSAFEGIHLVSLRVPGRLMLTRADQC